MAALFVCENAVKVALEYVDWWYVDMKLLVSDLCRDILGGDVDVYISNLKLIAKKAENICIRIPCHYYVSNNENVRSIIDILHDNAIRKVELLEIHNLSKKKYHALEMEIHDNEQKNRGAVEVIYTNLSKEKIECKKK